jgi:hypothetical protein
LGQSGYFIPNPQDEYSGCNGVSDRVRDSIAGNPVVLFFTNTTASLVATSPPEDGAGRSMPTGQSIADVQALPLTAKEAPGGDESAAYQSQTENRQLAADEYQVWLQRKMHGHKSCPCKS